MRYVGSGIPQLVIGFCSSVQLTMDAYDFGE